MKKKLMLVALLASNVAGLHAKADKTYEDKTAEWDTSNVYLVNGTVYWNVTKSNLPLGGLGLAPLVYGVLPEAWSQGFGREVITWETKDAMAALRAGIASMSPELVEAALTIAPAMSAEASEMLVDWFVDAAEYKMSAGRRRALTTGAVAVGLYAVSSDAALLSSLKGTVEDSVDQLVGKSPFRKVVDALFFGSSSFVTKLVDGKPVQMPTTDGLKTRAQIVAAAYAASAAYQISNTNRLRQSVARTAELLLNSPKLAIGTDILLVGRIQKAINSANFDALSPVRLNETTLRS